MGKYNEIKSSLKLKKKIQKIHLLEDKRRENIEEIKKRQMKQKLDKKRQIQKISDENLKSWRKKIFYKFKKFYNFLRFIITLINFFSLFAKLNQKKYYSNYPKLL